jgi:hypothetical protein
MDSKFIAQVNEMSQAQRFSLQIGIKASSSKITGITIHAYLEPVEIIVHSDSELSQSEQDAIQALIDN